MRAQIALAVMLHPQVKVCVGLEVNGRCVGESVGDVDGVSVTGELVGPRLGDGVGALDTGGLVGFGVGAFVG